MTAYPFAEKFPSVLVTAASFFPSPCHEGRNGAEEKKKRRKGGFASNEPLVAIGRVFSLTSSLGSDILECTHSRSQKNPVIVHISSSRE